MADRLAEPDPTVQITSTDARFVVLSSAVGTAIEFYDFALYGLASVLVFAPTFFPSDSKVAGQLAALATFAVGFLLRPIGGVVAGHFGDRIGRKRIMIWSFILMGTATSLVAVLPSYAAIGVAAPVILVVLRMAQGFAAGAEWGGAALMAIEHAPPDKRGLYGSSPSFGTTAGGLLASCVFLIVAAVAKDQFVAYGWRIAFGSSVVLVVGGYFIRRRVTESPIFLEALRHEPPRVPLLRVLRRHPTSVLRSMSWALVGGVVGYTVNTFAVAYALQTTAADRSTALWALNVAYTVGLVSLLVVGRLVDRWRRPVLLTVALAQVPAVILLFPLLSTGTVAAVFVSFSLIYLAVGAMDATKAVVFADMFPVEVRYTGVALSYNLALAIAGLMPLVAASIVASTGSIVWIVVIMTVVSLVALPVAFQAQRTQDVRIVINDQVIS